MDRNYLRRREAADFLQTHFGFGTEKTLAKLATIGGGPRYRKAGKFPLYTPADLEAWAQAKLSKPFNSTAEYQAA